MVHTLHSYQVISQKLDLYIVKFLQIDDFEGHLLFGELMLDHVYFTDLPLKEQLFVLVGL